MRWHRVLIVALFVCISLNAARRSNPNLARGALAYFALHNVPIHIKDHGDILIKHVPRVLPVLPNSVENRVLFKIDKHDFSPSIHSLVVACDVDIEKKETQLVAVQVISYVYENGRRDKKVQLYGVSSEYYY